MPGHEDDVDAVMRAARVLVALSAQAIAAHEDRVTLPQLRILVMLASSGALNLAGVADGLGVHPSNATRAVDRLVAAGLVRRREDPADRRHLVLRLTAAGRMLVDQVMGHRRAAVIAILDRMPHAHRRDLGAALGAFVDAADEVSADAVWSLGWTTNPA